MTSVWIVLAVQMVWLPTALSEPTKPLYHELSSQMFRPPGPGLSANALFGYSVAYEPTSKRLIITSPKADHVGQVFACHIREETCKGMNVLIEKDDLHDYWLGATVKAGSDFFVVCAPRYFTSMYGVDEKLHPATLGMCFKQSSSKASPPNNTLNQMAQVASDTRDKDALRLYREALSDPNLIKAPVEYKMDSYGWSIDINEEGNTYADVKILVGGPAMTAGKVMYYKIKNDDTQTQIIKVENNLFSKSNGRVSFNFGYGIASGKFFSEAKSYAISSPYGELGKGKILFFNTAFIFMGKVLLDNELGSLFGAALCAARLGSDGRQSLLVGAPVFAPTASTGLGSNTTSGPSYDVGAVHVYHFNGKLNLEIRRTIIGTTNTGYFGSAIVTVGDLNGDGKDEVAISAPYEDAGRGAVYVYSGADLFKDERDIPKVKWLQKIQAEIKYQNLGLSLTALTDYDDNGCNELAIGIPSSNTVMLLRCMASVTIQVVADLPDLQNHEKESLQADKNGNFFVFNPCLHVTYPEKPPFIVSDISVEINITHPNVTMASADDNGLVTYLAHLREKRPSYCRRVEVRMPENGDYDQPIQFSISAKLVKDPLEIASFDDRLVTLSELSNTSLVVIVSAPGSLLDFTVDSTMTDGYIIGSSDAENVTVTVTNSGRIAYGACLRVRIAGVSVARRPPGCTLHPTHFQCSTNGPLLNNAEWNGTFTLDTKPLTSDDKQVQIHLELLNRCSNEEGTPYNKTIKLLSDTKGFSVTSNSTPGYVVNVPESELSSNVVIYHTYTIVNQGVTNWAALEAIISLPPDVDSSVSIESTECNKTGLFARCNIEKINRNDKLQIFITMDIPPKSPTMDIIEKGSKKFETHLQLSPCCEDKTYSTTTTVKSDFVPLWIIIVAALIGLLLVLILGFILREFGCLRRKNQEKLKELKSDVKRQSVRRSMRLRDSMITVLQNSPDDRQRLVSLPEEDGPSGEDRMGHAGPSEPKAATKTEIRAQIH